MTTAQRQRLFDALLGDTTGVPAVALKEFIDLATADLDVLEPIIDQMLFEATQEERSANSDVAHPSVG